MPGSSAKTREKPSLPFDRRGPNDFNMYHKIMEINPQNQQIHLLGLNDQQRDAVLCRNDIVYVSAGPGTGKTHMLTSKLVDFIVSSEEPQKIVALSYTNTAARQLGVRFEKKVREF